MKILPTHLIKELDAYTIQHEPISSIDLMERAAVALTNVICTRHSDTNTPFVIFAGPGNNGGDALAIARLMILRGYCPEVYLFNPKDSLSTDCSFNREHLIELKDCIFHEVKTKFTPPKLTPRTVVIDGLFGSGLNKPLEGGFASVVRFINASPATVIAIDIPSGLMGEDNSLNDYRHVIKADLTLSLQLPKLSFLFAENDPYVGEWQLVDIGLSKEALESMPTDYSMTEVHDIIPLLERLNKRPRHAHKGSFGRALLIAGSEGMAGASVLASKACLRAGVGLLTVRIPFCNNFIIQTAVPEAITDIDIHDRHFTEAVDTDTFQAVAIGPGLGKSTQTEHAVIEQLNTTLCPMILDADALNILSQHPEGISHLPKGCILTPHLGELERLIGRCTNSYDRLQRAVTLAAESNAVIILKGAYSAMITPEGNIYFNTTGNPGMATAGSGDTLTGILLALLAQGFTNEEAAKLGVWLHGKSGDLAAEDLGEVSMKAGDIIDYLPKAIKS